MRILFMGTPDFALFSLRALVQAGEEIVGVVTQPDKPKGRGYELLPPPVKSYALEAGLAVYQPASLRTEEFYELLCSLAPDMIVVAAYGKILPANVLEYPKYGCINVHGSLLPEYRGAAPMQRAIMDGKAQTGITTMWMDTGLDTGDMLLREVVEIDAHDNFETVHDKLGEAGARALLRTVEAARLGTLTRTKQDDSLATYAAKIEKSDCLIDFSLPCEQVHNRIRGLSPIPLAFTYTPDGKMLKVIASTYVDQNTAGAVPGEVLSTSDGVITVACSTGAVQLLTVLPEGKKRMRAADFINGRKIAKGDLLGAGKN
ncbi:MAG: methionyl-tRNA formyltransferase [Clostridia bacterium]|nr:methionyl-tRNA formyltransferase [Clostridia bacterium]